MYRTGYVYMLVYKGLRTYIYRNGAQLADNIWRLWDIRTYLGLRMMLEAIVKLYTGGAVILLNPAGKCLDNSLKEVIASFYHFIRNYADLVRLVTYAAGNTTLSS